MANPKKILLIHGRGQKPSEEQTKSLWLQAIKTGLARDQPRLLNTFEAIPIDFFYFADKFTEYRPEGYDAELDLEDRLLALKQIQALTKTSAFRRKHYDKLPGKTAIKEFVMDAGASLGLGGILEKRLVPELAAYREGKAQWVNQEKKRLIQLIGQHFEANANLLIIGHCLGSVMAFDALWALSNSVSPEAKRVQLITLGSPLGASTVQQSLDGAAAEGSKAYPTTIARWHNLSAEDDYVSHDKTVADDYRTMLRDELVEDIQDYTIYNPTLRFGRSNPHSSVGYLAHPKTASLIGEWLANDR